MSARKYSHINGLRFGDRLIFREDVLNVKKLSPRISNGKHRLLIQYVDSTESHTVVRFTFMHLMNYILETSSIQCVSIG